jgi:hypothetical protein
MKARFAFQSEGENLVGNLFLRERSEPAGVVVAVGPLTSVKEQAAGAYARAMAERGFAALAFDYRCFGESDGQPRQFENPAANIEDIRNAPTALLADDRLTGLPLFGLGICFGAGPMVRVVAEDSRFRAFAGVAGVYTDNARTKSTMGDAYQATIDRGRAAEREWCETGDAETIPAVGPDGGDVAMPLREACLLCAVSSPSRSFGFSRKGRSTSTTTRSSLFRQPMLWPPSTMAARKT